MNTPLRPGETDVVWRYDLYHPDEDEPFHSDYHRSPEILAFLLPVTLARDDVDRIEIVRCPTLGATPVTHQHPTPSGSHSVQL